MKFSPEHYETLKSDLSALFERMAQNPDMPYYGMSVPESVAKYRQIMKDQGFSNTRTTWDAFWGSKWSTNHREQYDTGNYKDSHLETATRKALDELERAKPAQSNKLTPARFSLSGSEPFEGFYTPAQNWNGYCVPFFTKEQAQKVCERLPGIAGSIFAQDGTHKLFVILPAGTEDGIINVEYTALESEYGPLFPIGGYEWAWELED